MNLFGWNVAIVATLMLVLWCVSVIKRDASIVDPWWSVGFVLVGAHTAWRTGWTPAKGLLLVMLVMWGLRLWLHLLVRSIGKPEDVRYQAFRRHFGPHRYWWVSLFQVFLLQGLLIVVISAPLQVALSTAAPDALTGWDLAGLVVWLVGFLFEALGDLQLARFRAEPACRGRVLDTGLWRYSRHPNYFGDALVWWGFWLCALDTGWIGWASIYAPALMTFLLVRISGVRLLDQHLATTRPGYAEYMARTPGFVPGWRRGATRRP